MELQDFALHRIKDLVIKKFFAEKVNTIQIKFLRRERK